MGWDAVIDASKDAHRNWEATHCVVQKTVRDHYWLHLEPVCHVNVRLVHCHDAGEKQCQQQTSLSGHHMSFCNNNLQGRHQRGMIFVVQQKDRLLCQKMISVLIACGT